MFVNFIWLKVKVKPGFLTHQGQVNIPGIVRTQLLDYLNDSQLSEIFQSGFKPFRSSC